LAGDGWRLALAGEASRSADGAPDGEVIDGELTPSFSMALTASLARPSQLQLVQLLGCHQDGTRLGTLGRADYAAPFEKVHEPAGPSEADSELALEHGGRA
jgi:hypothetical protein